MPRSTESAQARQFLSMPIDFVCQKRRLRPGERYDIAKLATIRPLFTHLYHATTYCILTYVVGRFRLFVHHISMTDTVPFPTSTSSLLLPAASQNLSSTLSCLKRSTLSTTNRLHSIYDDSIFVQNVASSYGLPLVANERCGSWYIPTDHKAGSAYFKSTDGHWGQWSFSTRRLNLQILSIIGRSGG